MSDNSYCLSPYCVFYPQTDGEGALLIHGLYGSRFALSPELFQVILTLLGNTDFDAATKVLSAEAQTAITTLIEEKVLITRQELSHFASKEVFSNRLDPLELAFHRALNEGGFFPDLVDLDSPPRVAKEEREAEYVPLRSYATLDSDRSLTECLATRRSIRSYADMPLPKRLLEQLLQFTARAHALVLTPQLGWISLRNYPSGGARYPLEIYPVVYNVTDLEAGIYRYCPFQHRLEVIASDPEHRQLLLVSAKRCMGDLLPLRGDPAVLFVITAVFARTCWKYRGIPYHIILRETGALYQTLYLAATSLNLAPCAIGAFPERAVAEILHLNSCDEAQVGFFALGVPESIATHQAMFTITDVTVLAPSPFSSDPGGKALELTLSNHTKEIIDLARLSLEASQSDTRLRCWVMRGRYLAEFDEDSRQKLLRLLDG